MCRLLGLMSKEPVSIELSLTAAEDALVIQSKKDTRGKENADGWGIVWYDGRKFNIKKSIVGAYLDPEFFNLAEKISASLLISHIRYKTQGELNIKNTHPFAYHCWYFAHNGTIYNKEDFEPYIDMTAIGDTDSERFFRYLMAHVLISGNPVDGIIEGLQYVVKNFKYSALNFLMMSRNWFIAFRKIGTGNPEDFGLYYVVQDYKDVHKILISQLMEIKYSEDPDYDVLLIASEKLSSDLYWNELGDGELLVCYPKIHAVKIEKIF